MISVTARVVVALLLVGGAPLAAAGGAEPGLELGVTVRGRASAGGRSLAGADVRLLPLTEFAAEPVVEAADGPDATDTTRTRADGSFSLTAPGPGPWGVRIDTPGRVGQEIAIEILDGAVRIPPVELPEAHDLEVRVLDADLEAGVARVAWPSGRQVGALPLNRWRVTPVAALLGEGGTATLPVAADGGGEVQVIAPGFQPLRMEKSGSLVVVELAPAPPVEVRVLDAAGSPLAGVRIFDGGGPLPVAVTDRAGRARMSEPVGPPGTTRADGAQEVTLLAPDGSFSSVPFPVFDSGSGTLRFEPPRRISGRVLERGTGRPLGEALVWSRPPAPSSVTHTDGSGAFELPVSGDPPASLVVVAPGHRSELVAAEVGRAVEISLRARRVAVGQVVDQADRPVRDAEVRLRAVPGERLVAGGAAHGPFTTGADGTFEVPNPSAGRFDLKVEASGFGPVTVPGVEMPAQVADVDLGVVVLSAGVTLAGRVLDDAGSPVEAARVLMAPAGSGPWEASLAMGGAPRETLTDAEGAFSFADLSYEAAVRLQARKEGFVASEVRDLVVLEDATVEVLLERPATLSGWVVDGTGRSIGGALVTVGAPPAGGASGEAAEVASGAGQALHAWTGPDGDFDLPGLHPGRWAVRASAAGHRDGAGRTVEVEAGDELPGVEIVLEAGASLDVRVVDSGGTPAAGATVDLMDGEGRSVAFGRVDGDGRFRFTGQPSGTHVLTAVAADGRTAQARVDLGDLGGGQQEATLVLDGGVRVRGRVVRVDGSPVAGARVLLTQARSTGATAEARTDPFGRFEWPMVEEGVYHLAASADGLSPTRGIVLSVEREPVADLELVLDEGITLRGQVLGVAFPDLPSVSVRALGVPGAIARPDHAGAFVLHHLPAGELVVEVGLEGTGHRTLERLELPAGAREVEASLWLAEPPPGAD